MKMKELRERLNQKGFDVSERMVKYYIQTGLLPEPEYPYPNQADYKDIHLLRLQRICGMKERMSFGDIKEIIAKETRLTELAAEAKNIDPNQYALSFEAYAKEQFEYEFEHENDSRYTKDEMLKAADCDSIVYEIALDTGVLKEKPVYCSSDLIALMCVRNYIGINASDKGIVEKIGDISKIHSIASQMINYYIQDKELFWIYDNLFKALIKQKIKDQTEQDKQTI